MTSSRTAPVVIWLAFLVACVFVIARANFTTDLSAILPRAPTADQQVLIDQLTEGAASRMILIGLKVRTRRREPSCPMSWRNFYGSQENSAL